MQQKWVYLLAVLALSLGVYLAVTIAPVKTSNLALDAQTEYMQWYPNPRKLADFELSKHDGSMMSNADLQGKWTLVFMGYTYCPDICPVTLAELNSVYPQLKSLEQETPLQVWFMSVDPQRDSVERLNEYIRYFNADFIATTGPHTVLFPLVRSMGMMYALPEGSDTPDYLVDHSGAIAVINPDGNIVGRFKPQHQPGQLSISDTQQILTDLPVLLQNG